MKVPVPLIPQIPSYILSVFRPFLWRFGINAVLLRPETKESKFMVIKKVSYEEALARFKHSLEVKRAAEKRIADEWARRGLTGTIVAL